MPPGPSRAKGINAYENMITRNHHHISLATMFWMAAALTLFGQANRGGMIQNLPILIALDADGNGEISDTEIMDSAAALGKLDKNKEGKLTPDELRPSFVANRNRKDGNRGIQNSSAFTQTLKPLPPVAKQIEGISTRINLKLFGAKGRHGGTESELANYRRVFGFSDTDKDGQHSKKEYIDYAAYLTPQSRQGIFRHPIQTTTATSPSLNMSKIDSSQTRRNLYSVR